MRGRPLTRALTFVACLLAASCSGSSSSTPSAGVCRTGFTACVHACGEHVDREWMAADCEAGIYKCPAGTVAAVTCPLGSWPDPSQRNCGPWVEGYDFCGICTDRLWVSSPCGDGSAD